MPDSEIAARLRSVLDEVCAQSPITDPGTRTNVASKLLEAIEQGRCSLDDLRKIGRDALQPTPTMWRQVG